MIFKLIPTRFLPFGLSYLDLFYNYFYSEKKKFFLCREAPYISEDILFIISMNLIFIYALASDVEYIIDMNVELWLVLFSVLVCCFMVTAFVICNILIKGCAGWWFFIFLSILLSTRYSDTLLHKLSLKQAVALRI